ncbi:MAG: ATP-binding protein [Paraburkholderia sp.]|uniref:ATP-binding protein n=1 Tax=unclassified Paraburkholderia TaxID=2615204 RepID=UPI0028571CF9|nr:ATP-binding protein [Paraburkholderia sp. USG1]MDR8394817.1 ATP-binding protein [Paraburkholderia sp. USG1]
MHVINVTNQGTTIAPEHIDRIVERFNRVDTSRHGSARNTGPGLAIVKSIIDLHRVRLRSRASVSRRPSPCCFPRPAAVQAILAYR